MKHNLFKTVLTALILLGLAVTATAQKIQYSRTYDQKGINVFEPSKKDTVAYEGFKIRIGGSFTQNYQSFKSTNKANYVATSGTNTLNKNLLYGLIKPTATTFQNNDSTTSRLNGFNLAMAN
ncbi:MAG: hypothetical protein K2X48_02565 [Chitinophagaceae bacterium]|nr:hypothetical protein [Chitinophagaceae bacterium]